MVRVKRGVVVKKRHKKILKQAKGYYSARSRAFKVANQSVIRAKQYAYYDRKKKKSFFKSLWISRINSAVHLYGMTYSVFKYRLKKFGFSLNTKILADMVFNEKNIFHSIILQVKEYN